MPLRWNLFSVSFQDGKKLHQSAACRPTGWPTMKYVLLMALRSFRRRRSRSSKGG